MWVSVSVVAGKKVGRKGGLEDTERVAAVSPSGQVATVAGRAWATADRAGWPTSSE